MEGLKKTLGKRLRILREERGLTLEEAAGRAGLDAKYWGKIERGKMNSTLESLEKVLRGLEAEPIEIFMVGLERPLANEKKELVILRSLLRRMGNKSRRHILGLAKHLAQVEQGRSPSK